MKLKERILLALTVCLTAVSLVVGTGFVLLGEPVLERMLNPASALMMIELAVLWSWCYFSLGRKKGWLGVLLAAAVFLWLHQAFLAVAVSGIYLCCLLLLGDAARRILDKQWPENTFGCLEILSADLLIGSGIWICMVCLLSAFSLGGISNLRILSVGGGSLLFLHQIIRSRKEKRPDGWVMKRLSALTLSGTDRIFAALIVVMVLLQAGRMNIALDYDSLHYGLRTPYILNNGTGIYQNLGNINLVYTYSKGLETLVMPLAGTSTYGYVLCFNLWISVLVIGVVYGIASELWGAETGGEYVISENPENHTWALGAAACISVIPGIMNMAATAKTDNITLLFQLFILWFTLRFLAAGSRQLRTRYFILSGCCCLVSFTFKPTSLVFSTVAFGLSFLWMVFQKGCPMVLKSRWWGCAIVCVTALTGIWARTVYLMGVPVTSVFTPIFDALGFRVKPPFAFSGIPDNGSSLSFMEGMVFWGKRLVRLALIPTGEDMGHVIIAWGTPLVLVLVICVLYTAGKRFFSYLYVVWAAIGIVSAVSVRMLWQVDGNYFMLFYALSGILGITAIYKITDDRYRKGFALTLSPLIVFAAVACCVTNWSGTAGFTPIKLLHKGYYNHRQEAYEESVRWGSGSIFKQLEADPASRVIAFGPHPDVLIFPCNVQSYYDVTGSGGNVVLVKTLNNFKDFLRYAKTDYIYVQALYLEPGSRAYDVVRYMIEDGSLTDIRYEEGNLLGRVSLEGDTSVFQTEEARQFYETYKVKLQDE